MKLKDYIIRIIRKLFRKISNKKFKNPDCIYNRQIANNLIFDLLNANEPCLIARFGTTELITINNYLCIHSEESKLKKVWNYITENTHTPWWYEKHFKFLDQFSGVFPPTQNISELFAKRYLNDIPLIDMLGSFQYYEKYMPLKENIVTIQLETMYPFFVENPWTLALKNKKVLIVHPFENTIQKQYQMRLNLFKNTDVLPEFNLITFKAIQSAAGVRPVYADWFQALNYMEDEIAKIDFDICILGCGAYGLPLAASIKRMGKKAIHLGGGLQLLFGIKGKRWDNPEYGKKEYIDYPDLMKESYCSLYNEHWVKANLEETPESANKLDGAIYW